MWPMSFEIFESSRPLIAAVLTTFGLIVLSRLFPAFDRMTEHPSSGLVVAYDICLAISLAFTFSSFLAGLGFV